MDRDWESGLLFRYSDTLKGEGRSISVAQTVSVVTDREHK
jgi:hypothetical protein